MNDRITKSSNKERSLALNYIISEIPSILKHLILFTLITVLVSSCARMNRRSNTGTNYAAWGNILNQAAQYDMQTQNNMYRHTRKPVNKTIIIQQPNYRLPTSYTPQKRMFGSW